MDFDLGQLYSIAGMAAFLAVLFQVLKTNLLKDERFKDWIPVLAAVTGWVLMWVVSWALGSLTTRQEFVRTAFMGVIAGFAATGFYEQTFDKLRKALNWNSTAPRTDN